MVKLQFWYDFASTYSYLSAMRIERLAGAHDVEIDWRPFLLGPIFVAQGWNNSPFNIYPTKGKYMVRDMQRICAERDLPFSMPPVFPARSLTAARLGLVGVAEGWIGRFTRTVYSTQFSPANDGEERADISEPAALAAILEGLGIDAEAALARASSAEIKQDLKDQTETAVARGVFGAPTFITGDGELFWGDDRLEQALDWAVHGSSQAD